STSYTYSPPVLVTVGYSLPIGILTGNTTAFLVLLVASVVAAFIGSVTVEILRSLLARASTAFNKVGGRSMIALRILGVLLILLLLRLCSVASLSFESSILSQVQMPQLFWSPCFGQPLASR